MPHLITYLGEPELKTALLAEITAHEEADAIIKGTYGRMNGAWRGCAIGCSLRSLNKVQGKTGQDLNRLTGEHDRFPRELGWPLWLAYAEDNIFENLPDELAKTWPRRLADAIPVGVTVPDVILAKLLHWILVSDIYGVVHAAANEKVKTIVLQMGVLFARVIGGETVTDAEFDAAARTARDAWDAWAARTARTAWAARNAWAASDARDAWAARDAWDAFYPELSNELIRLVRGLHG